MTRDGDRPGTGRPDPARLEADLVEAGERWRAGLPPTPDIGRVWRVPTHRSSTGLLGLIAASLVLVALAGALGSAGGRSPNGSAASSPRARSNVAIAWNAEQVRAAEVHPGDAVSATGIVMIDGSQAPRLCAGAFDRLMFGVPPTCGTPAVALAGALDLATLPGRKLVADTTFSTLVTVVGRWTGASIEVATLAASPDHGYLPPLPCPTPPGGWVNPATDGAFRSALAPLAAEIAAHPDLYVGYVTQPTYGSPGNLPDVEIVRTRVDPRTVSARVEALFPYATCLTNDYSEADLDSARSAFAAGTTFVPNDAGDSHRLEVAVAAIDDQTLPLFLTHPAAYPKLLVTRVASDAPAVSTDEPTIAPTVAPSSAASMPDASFELPSALDGQPVLVGDAALAAFQASTDATPMLVGGWLSAPVPMFCPMLQSPNPFWACSGVFIRPRPFGGPSAMVLHQGAAGLTVPVVPAGETMPVVFRVHTHDPLCSAQDCLLQPVADALVWSGGIGPIPSPTSTQPPDGISEATARATAVTLAKARARGSFSLVVVSARAGHYAEVGPPGSMDVDGDRWVWAVVVSGVFGAPDCASTVVPCDDTPLVSTSLIVLDYVAGEVLIQETPAPSS